MLYYHSMNLPKNQQLIDGSAKWFESHLFSILAVVLITLVVYLIGSRLIIFIIKHLVKGARHRAWHQKDIEKRQKTLINLFLSLWRILVFFTVTYTVLSLLIPNLSRTLAPLFASAGIIGLALGIGAQSLIKDFISGLFIISENQYRVGDVVEIEGFSGTVERIGTRSTVLRDVNGNVHYFPNGMVQHVINKTMGFSMARFTVLVRPDADIDKVSHIIDAIGSELASEDKWKEKIIKAPAFVSVGEITGNSTEIIVAGKTQPSDQWSVIAEMRRRLLEEFESAKILLAIMPFNQIDKK